MNNNLNNLKIKNPFGKFLRNIFLGVLLLIIGFGGALIVPNLVVNANSPGGSGSGNYDNDKYGGYNYPIYGGTGTKGISWSTYNEYRNYAYTAIAREYTSDGEKASNNGYGVTKDGSNIYYEAVYYSFSDVLITSRGFRCPSNDARYDGTQYSGSPVYITDAKQIDNSAGGTEYVYYEYTNLFGLDCYSGLSIDKTPWQSGVSTANNQGQQWYSVYPRRTGAMVAINTNNYDFIGYQIATSDAFYGSPLKMARDSNGYYLAGEDDGLTTRRFRLTGRTGNVGIILNYLEIEDVDTGELMFVDGVDAASIPTILGKNSNGEYESTSYDLFVENRFKTGVLPTNQTGWASNSSLSGRKTKEGYIKAKYLKEQNNGTVTFKALSNIYSAGTSGKASSILGNQKTSKYNDYNVYLSHQMSAGSNYVAMVQSKTTKNITLNLGLGDSYNGGLEEVTLRQYDYYPKLGAIPTKAGYKFKGYYTSSTGGTQMYTADGKPTMVWDGSYVNATWYAQWELANYTINYNNNGGTGSLSSQTTTYNTAIKLRANTFTKTGYTFGGWKVTSGLNSSVAKYGSSSSSCTASVSSSTIIPNNYYVKNLTGVVDGSVTLTAQWVGNPYTINFDSGDGTGTMDSQSATYGYGVNIKLKANTFTKTGYTFKGWKVTSGLNTNNAYCGNTTSCATRVTSSTIIGDKWYVENLTAVNNGSVTLTAQWTINTYTLTINWSIYGDGDFLGVDGIGGKSITVMSNNDNDQHLATYSTSPLSFSVYIAKGGDFVVNENYYLVLKNGSETLGEGSKIDASWTPTSNATYTVEVYNIYTMSAVAGTGVQTVTTTSNTSGFDNNKVKYGDNATFTATTKLGYDTFDGWYNGTTKVSSNLSYTLTGVKANTTLTAKATPNTYTVKYNKNNTSASGTMADSSFTYDVSSYLKSNSFIAPTGKVFIGWATSASGDAVYTNAGLVKNLTATKGGTVTLYAVWGEPQSVTDGLVLNLSKWSATSSTWYDISGNGYDMTMTTATPSIKGGYIYNSAFNGSSTKSLSLTSAVTLEADVTTGSANNGLLYIFGDYYNGGCALRTDGTRFQFVINIDGTEIKVEATSTWTANTNYHLVGTYDGSEAKLYINGQLINSVATTGSITSSTASKVLVGAGYSSATNITYNYTGSIHKIKVFNRALTDSEITIEQNIADYSVTYSPNDGRNANLWNFRNIASSTNTTVVSRIVDNILIFTGSTLTFAYQGSTKLSKTASGNYSCSFTVADGYSTFTFGATSTNITYNISSLTQGVTYTFSFTANLSGTTWTISSIKLEEGVTKTEYSEPMQNVSFGDPYFWIYNNKFFTPETGYKFNGWMKPLDLSETVTNKNIMLYFNNKTQNNVVKYGSNTIMTTFKPGYTQVIYNNLSGVLSGFTFSGSYSNLKIISTGDTVYSGNNIHNIAKNIELSAYITQDEDAYNYEVDLNNNAYYFNIFQYAMQFCSSNSLNEITILKNVAVTTTVTINTDIILKGKDSSCGITFNGGGLTVATGKTLTIKSGTYSQTSTSALFTLNSSLAGNIVVQGGTFTSINNMFDVAAGSVTINNGKFNKTSSYYYIIQTSGSSVNFVINGGTFSSVGSIIFNNSSSKFEINGGTFSGDGIFSTYANMTISGGTFSSTGDISGFVGMGTTSLEIKGNPYFEKPIKVEYTMDENMSIKVIGDLQSNIKFEFYSFSSNYYKRAVVTFASGLNAQDYINNFTLINEGCGLYVDKSTNTLNASKYVKVSFNGGDLTPNSESKYVLYGDVYGDLPGASGIGGYKFSSWRKASGTEITKTSEVKTYEDHTLYANATKVYMMRDWSSKNTSVAKTAILSIEFINEKPTTGTQIDISGNLNGTYLGDGSVYAYYIANGNNYDVKIYSPYHLIYAPQNCSSMFYNFTNLTSIKFNNLLDTSDVTDMSTMFKSLSKLNELDLSSFNTEKVETMYQMFQGDSNLVTLNISSFNFLNLKNAGTIFGDLNNLENLIVNNFKTSIKLIGVAYMFAGIGINSLDLTDMVTDNVTDVGQMFQKSKLEEIDMSSCNFGKVTNVTNMLYNCTNLTMFKAPYGKPSLEITLPSGTWRNLNNINATVGNTAYADGGVYVKYNLEDASYLSKNWFNKLKSIETGITRSAITSISFKTSSTFTSSVDVSSSLVNNICGESEYLYDCYPVTLYYSKSGSSYSLEFVSSNTIYLPTDSSMLFADLTNLTEINLIGGLIQTASILNANYMFSRTALTTLNFKNLDFSGLKSADGMLNVSSLQQITTPKTVGMPINLPSTQFYNKSDNAKGPYKVINQNNVDVTIKLAYNIWFSANGGNNESCVRSVFAGETVNLNPTKLVDDSYSEYSYIRPGYTLKGWATSKNGTKVYDIGATITPTSNLSLYAVWEAISYNISYNYNGGTAGSGSYVSSIAFDKAFTVPKPTKTGYTFKGWTTSIDESNIYAMSNGERWSGKSYSNGTNLMNLLTTSGTITLIANFEKTQGSVVARIGNQEFASLKLAVDYANSQNSGTFIIYLLKSNKETSSITVNAGVTLNLVPQSTSEVQFELGTGSITNNGSLTLGYDDSMTYTDADGNALSKADLSGRFTLSSTGTTIYNESDLDVYNCKIVSGKADVENKGKIYLKNSPIFTNGISVVDSNLYVTGALSTIVPVVLDGDVEYFKTKGNAIVNFTNNALASSYANNFKITGYSTGYTSKVDTTKNSIVIAKISTLSYVVDGNIVDTESYIEGEQHALKTYSKEGYAFYGWYTEDPTGKMSTLTPISALDSSIAGDYKVYGKTIKYGERGVEGYSDSVLNINVNFDENLNASSVYGVIIVEYFDEDLGVNKVYTYSLRKGTITIKGLRYATYKITIKTTLKASSDVKEYSVRTSSNAESNVNINLTKVNKGGITSSETI